MDIIRELPAPVIFLGKLGLAFPFTYHTTNGIRHLVSLEHTHLVAPCLARAAQPSHPHPPRARLQMWDTVKGLDIASVYKSGWTTLGISSAAAVGLALL